MTGNLTTEVGDRFAALFHESDASEWMGGPETLTPDIVRTGEGWPTFEEIMAQVPEGPAKEATKELRGIVRRTPIKITWEDEALPPALVCPPQWLAANGETFRRAREVLLFRGAWEVIENYMGRAGLLLRPEEATGEVWGLA